MPQRRKSLDEIAKEEDEKVRTGRETEGYVRVPALVAKNPQHVMMVRFSMEEIALVREKAEARGLQVDEYVRQTALGLTR
jgi:hypothetical protein